MIITKGSLIVGLIATLPLLFFCGFVLFAACAAGACAEGLLPPYVEDEWKELLVLLVCSATCIGWLTGLIWLIVKLIR